MPAGLAECSLPTGVSVPAQHVSTKQKRIFLLNSVFRLGNHFKSDNGADKRSHGVLDTKAFILLEIY